jgi:hypothetical protein
MDVDRELITAESAEPLSFGQRMVRLKRERGLPQSQHAGRRPLAEKYRKQIAAVERTFADSLPQLAQQYVDELRPHAPEQCARHHVVLRCPVKGCEQQSERTSFDHRAAGYVIDRLLGKPSQRLEQTVAVRLVAELTETFAAIFSEVNQHGDPRVRQQAFAAECRRLSAGWGSGAG